MGERGIFLWIAQKHIRDTSCILSMAFAKSSYAMPLSTHGVTGAKRNIPWIPHRSSQHHVFNGEFGIADRITLSQPVNVSRTDRFFIWKEVLLTIRAPPLTTEYFFRYTLNYAAPVLDADFHWNIGAFLRFRPGTATTQKHHFLN